MKSLFAVFVGGILGTAARLLLDGAIPHADTDFPTSTLLINVLGSAVLGFLVARAWPTAAPWVRAGVGTGILGSFTTFSAVVVALVTLTDGGRILMAALYLALSLVLGFAAAAAGLRIGAVTASRTHTAPSDRREDRSSRRADSSSPQEDHSGPQGDRSGPHEDGSGRRANRSDRRGDR
jgi:CrcB protein